MLRVLHSKYSADIYISLYTKTAVNNPCELGFTNGNFNLLNLHQQMHLFSGGNLL